MIEIIGEAMSLISVLDSLLYVNDACCPQLLTSEIKKK